MGFPKLASENQINTKDFTNDQSNSNIKNFFLIIFGTGFSREKLTLLRFYYFWMKISSKRQEGSKS